MKLLDQFHPSKEGLGGRQSRCKQCESERRKIAYHTDGAGLAKMRKWNWSRYGLTPDDYQRMLDQQDGKCAVCHQSDTQKHALHVDHCHATGKVRALLCGRCNAAIGNARDDPARLRACAEYLERHQEG